MKNSLNLKKRGYINEIDLEEYLDLSPKELLILLKSSKAYDRTIAVRLLDRNNTLSQTELSNRLLHILAKEKSLYTKIEICNVLAKSTIQTAKAMIAYLCKIGSNQHRCLPGKVSKKGSYPLPRDIIARTLGKMNIEVLSPLLDTLEQKDINQIREVIDAIGYMCFYNEIANEELVIEKLMKCFNIYKNDDIIRWKIVMAFSSFKDEAVITWLEIIGKTDKEKLIRNEAKRSLKLLRRNSNV